VDYAFRQLKMARVIALTFQGNDTSVKVMQRAGMSVGYHPDPDVVYPWAVGMINNTLPVVEPVDKKNYSQ
jgi:RimJ/RimL family protein N-acetyltransferase